MIKVSDLWKRYGENQVLKGLSLLVEKGETLVILGRSGVGKSVLLRQILGIEKADKGYVDVGSRRISTMNSSERYEFLKHVGMLFQGSALFDSMNIFDNVAFHLKEHGNLLTGEKYSNEELERLVEEALEMVNLKGLQMKMPSDLSGGMRKRVALARIIIYRPNILLYDEPTTGLDPITAMQINELIVRIQNELHVTSIVVTHDIQSAFKVADRLALHHDGKIVHVARKEEFFKIDDSLIKNFLRNAFLREGVLE